MRQSWCSSQSISNKFNALITEEKLYNIASLLLALAIIYSLIFMLSSGFKETHRLLNELDNFRQNDHTLGQRLRVAGDNGGLHNPPNAAGFINSYYSSLQGVYRRAKIQNFKNMLDFLIPDKVFGNPEWQRVSNNNIIINDNDTVQSDNLPAALSASGKSKSIQEKFKKHFNLSKLHNRYSKIPLLSQKLVSKLKSDNSDSNNSYTASEPTSQHNKKEQQRDKSKDQVCPICLDLLTVGKSIIKELPCHHCYHVECIEAWFFEYANNNAVETLGGFNEMEFNCPYCRFDVYYYVLNNYDKNR